MRLNFSTTTGKSILASNLAARFGLSVVLHTTQVLAIIESTVRLARASRLRLQNEQQQKGVPEVRKTSLESSVASVGARGSGEAGAPEMKSEGESTQSLESDYDISHLFPPPSVSPLPTSSSQSPSASPSILQVPLWHREYATPAALHRDYDCAARVVAKALEAEIRKVPLPTSFYSPPLISYYCWVLASTLHNRLTTLSVCLILSHCVNSF